MKKIMIFSLPVFVRENTLLPIGAVDTTVDYELEKDVQIQVYEVNETASCEVVTRKGETAFTVKAVREEINSLWKLQQKMEV